MMKKITCMLLASVLYCCFLAACDNDDVYETTSRMQPATEQSPEMNMDETTEMTTAEVTEESIIEYDGIPTDSAKATEPTEELTYEPTEVTGESKSEFDEMPTETSEATEPDEESADKPCADTTLETDEF